MIKTYSNKILRFKEKNQCFKNTHIEENIVPSSEIVVENINIPPCNENTTATTVIDKEIKEEIKEEIKVETETDTVEVENFENIVDYDTIVISGGSTTGIVSLGAIQYAFDNFLLGSIINFIGTSSGSIICFLLIIGYTPIEIIIYICKHQLLEKMQHFNIISMTQGSGAISFNTIYEHLEKMCIDKIGFIPTFKDVKDKFDKNLICVTYNITENKTEYISFETYPNMHVLTALKMSSNLPLIFENFKYGNSFYIDGGISDNFPIDIGDKIGKKVLGIYLVSGDNSKEEINNNILEFIYKLIFIPISKNEEYKILNVSKKCRVVKLTYDNIKFFNFKLQSKEKLDLFSEGYEQMRKLLD